VGREGPERTALDALRKRACSHMGNGRAPPRVPPPPQGALTRAFRADNNDGDERGGLLASVARRLRWEWGCQWTTSPIRTSLASGWTCSSRRWGQCSLPWWSSPSLSIVSDALDAGDPRGDEPPKRSKDRSAWARVGASLLQGGYGGPVMSSAGPHAGPKSELPLHPVVHLWEGLPVGSTK